MNIHHLKSWSHFYDAIKIGVKTHDLRYDVDRHFEVGDRVILQKYDNIIGEYTGECLDADITYITSSKIPCAFSSSILPKEYCILSLKVRK